MTDTLARNLIILRTEKNLTQQELGDAAGVSPSQISRYETGQAAPRKTMLRKLAEALGVSIEQLTADSQSRPGVQIYEGFSTRLLELRCSKKISTRLLAKKTGIDPSALNEFELAEALPSSDEIYSIADALGVSVSELAGQKDEPENVKLKLHFEERPNDPVVFAASENAYRFLIETAKKFGLTPGEVLERYLDAIVDAQEDPDNASEAALQLLNSMKFD